MPVYGRAGMYQFKQYEAKLPEKHMRSSAVASPRRLTAAISLVEILVVIAIIIVLVAIVLPSLIGAKKSAKSVDDLSKLKQLGLAANLYREETGRWPRGTNDLVILKLIPTEICSFSADPSAKGLANQVGVASDSIPVLQPLGLEVSFRNSPIGHREYRLEETSIDKWVEPGTAGGWLVDFSASKLVSGPTPNDYTMSEGTYRRLCFDTSIVKRHFINIKVAGDVPGTINRMPISFYVDPSEEMMKWLGSHF
jgi:type II secretory pathway pseudopilin PulG